MYFLKAVVSGGKIDIMINVKKYYLVEKKKGVAVSCSVIIYRNDERNVNASRCYLRLQSHL